IHRDGVKLRRRDGVDEFPRRGLVVADIQPAVVADDQVVGVIRIDPQRVVIAVRDTLNHLERLTAVSRFVEGSAASVDDLIILRVNANLAVVHGAVVVVAHQAPGLALVIRTPDAAAFRIRRLIGLRLLAPAAAAAETTAAGLLFTAARATARADLDLR